jgi:hypothetical protein
MNEPGMSGLEARLSCSWAFTHVVEMITTTHPIATLPSIEVDLKIKRQK